MDAILAEVRRRMGKGADSGIIEAAVHDAVTGRQLRGEIELVVPCDSIPVAHRRLSDMLEAYSPVQKDELSNRSITVVVLTA